MSLGSASTRRLPPGTHAPSDWPLASSLEFGPLPGAVPCARLHTRQIMWEWRQARVTDAAELIVSELVTNAITAVRATGAPAPIRLWLASDGERLLIAVGDASPHPPQRVEPAGDTESGRGLLLVESLSSDWGWYATTQDQTVKVVWAELRPDQAP